MMDIDKLEAECNRLMDESLSRLKPEDPDYAKVVGNLETLNKIANDVDRRELERMKQYSQADINEAELKVEMQKVRCDRLRHWLDFAKGLLGVSGSVGLGYMAYHEELKNFKLPIRAVMDFAKGLIPKK